MIQAEVNRRLDYNPDTGSFTWRKSGKLAGCLSRQGYLRIQVNGKKRAAHRLAWFMTYGAWPSQLDHINRVRDDNRLANLREATDFINSQNRKVRDKKGDLPTGVFCNGKRFTARIRFNKVDKGLGTFDTPEEAGQAYQEARGIYHDTGL